MFFVGDQPYLDTLTVNKLLEIFRKGKNAIVVPTYGGVEGNPVIFPSSLAKELCELKGDRGGKTIIDSMRERVKLVPRKECTQGMDIDTREDYEQVNAG
jgi:molybdenum cofactor cytidylyltransferase